MSKFFLQVVLEFIYQMKCVKYFDDRNKNCKERCTYLASTSEYERLYNFYLNKNDDTVVCVKSYVKEILNWHRTLQQTFGKFAFMYLKINETNGVKELCQSIEEIYGTK